MSRIHTKMANFMQEKELPQKEDLLFKALNSTGLPSNTPATKRETLGKVCILDKSSNKKYFVSKVSKTSDGSKVYLCNFCPKDFKRPSDLCRHMNIHALDLPFKCRFCPRAFSVKSTLSTHMKIHTESSKHHACTLCFKQFESTKSLKEHQKTHKKVINNVDVGEPFIITPHGLVKAEPRHKSVYQPSRLEALQRKYRCTSCTASFKKSSHLKQHELR